MLVYKGSAGDQAKLMMTMMMLLLGKGTLQTSNGAALHLHGPWTL